MSIHADVMTAASGGARVPHYEELFEWAALMGVDAAEILAGAEVLHFFTLADYDVTKLVMTRSTEEQRLRRRETFFHPAIAARRRLGQGLHDRGEAYVFAGGDNPEADERRRNGRHFPLHVKSVTVLEKVVPAGEVWDVSVRAGQWGLDDIEELYTLVNVGRLTLERDAELRVQGNVFVVLCQELVAAPGARIRIAPTPFSLDQRHGPHRGRDGVHATAGASGRPGRAPNVENTIIGFRLSDAITPEELHGSPGGKGGDGGDGGDGRNGGPSKLAEITIRSLRGELTVYAEAGVGGDGGRGGDGADGGSGGQGAKGCRTLDGDFPSGRGGAGGDGGHGGDGGCGGSGGISSNVYVNVAEADAARVTLVARPGFGGRGGEGGRGGLGGAAGGASEPSLAAAAGAPGRDGGSGTGGRTRPAPMMFLNDVPASSAGIR